MRAVLSICLWTVLVVLSSAGCKRLKTGAREDFAERYSCPEDRVEVRERDDVKWSTVVLGDAPREAPPAEVKNDPGRLAKWHADRAEQDAETRETLDDLDVFQVRGCGHDELVACSHPADGDGVATDRVVCFQGPKRPNP
ncbi:MULTISPECIES: hypothetical protein [Sorangium]|uniref:Secreted protein n=1 Tax=Sorangium atrum TaxID=2995308 RepID=A0ABT5CIK2_9BACT|nr:hypothetical protein [Sorangium aterium]MDC0684952.1 hypothetical protein [Sorangium aterium]